MGILFAVVNSGQTVSGDIDMRKDSLLAIRVPTVTSGAMYLQGNIDSTSANFMRLADDQGALDFAVGPGSQMAMWPQGFQHLPYARIEMSVAQTDVRTFQLFTRPA